MIFRLWLEEHKERRTDSPQRSPDIIQRLEGFGENIKERIESPGYLALVKKAFRSWDQAIHKTSGKCSRSSLPRNEFMILIDLNAYKRLDRSGHKSSVVG